MGLEFAICREKHAIAEFQAIVRFTEPLDPASFGDVFGAAIGLSQKFNLPARVPMTSFAFEFGQVGGPRISPPPVNPLEVGFQRFSPDGQVEERISADPQSVSYMTRDYLGWEKTREILLDIFTQITAPYAKRSLLIGTVQVQYANDFSSQNTGFVPVQALFRKDTRWVPPIFAELDDLWHSHVGMFLPEEGFKNLVNVNVDVVYSATPERPEQFTSVKLLIIAARQFNTIGARPLAVIASEMPATLLANLDAAHDLEKSVLFETLSDEYLKAVNAK
jgi:uncharacterized protein (TIGR04255 family)